MNSANPNLDLTQGRASSSLLAAAGPRIQRECQQNYPRGLRPGEIAVTSGGNLRCTAIYHGVLTRYSSQRDEKVSGHVCCTIRYTFLLEGTLTPNSPYPALQPQVVRVLLRHHARCINMWLTYDKMFSYHAIPIVKTKATSAIDIRSLTKFNNFLTKFLDITYGSSKHLGKVPHTNPNFLITSTKDMDS